MLESLLLKNFQVHRNLEVQFSPTVTSIVGPSDVGKTALIRALRWACLNEAAGGLSRHGTNKTIVRMVIDGHTITRKRQGSGNAYVLDGKRYDAIRRDVPDAVRKRLAVRQLTFQGQHDSPFWLADSAGSVSRELNGIVDLSVIDTTLTNIARGLRESNTILKANERRLAAAEEEYGSLAWIEDACKDFEGLQEAEALAVETRARRRAVEEALNAAAEAKATQAHGKARLKAAQILLGTARAARMASKARKELANVLQQATQAATRASLQVPSIHKLDFAWHHREQLETLLTKLEAETKRCQSQKTKLTATLKRLQKVSKGRCPVCGKTMT